MDSDRRSSGELVIDEDAFMGSPRYENHIQNNRMLVATRTNGILNGHIHMNGHDDTIHDTSPHRNNRSRRKRKTDSLPAQTKTKTSPRATKVKTPPKTTTRAAAHKSLKKMHYFKLNTLKDMKTPSLSVSYKYYEHRLRRFLIIIFYHLSSILQISAKLHQFYNMRLSYLPQSILGAEVLLDYPTPPPLQDISLDQLLNWPGVGVVLSLRDITYTRNIVPHYEHSIVFGTDRHINLNKTENVTNIRRCANIITQKPGPPISKQIFETYIAAIEAATKLVDVSKSRSAEMQCILQKIKEDVEPMQALCAKTTYSKYPNKQKYMRTFDNEPDHGTKKRRVLKTFLREIINPEIMFTIERCSFLNHQQAMWEHEFCSFFEKLFVYKDQRSMNALKDIFKKCISFKCLICNTTFDGVLCAYATKAHLAMHYYDRDWSCIHCDHTWSQYDLARDGWSHKCSRNK